MIGIRESFKISKKRLFVIIPVLALLIALIHMGDESKKPIMVYGDRFERPMGEEEDSRAVYVNPENGFAGEFLKSPFYLLDPGLYHVRINYEADGTGSSLFIIDNGRPVSSYEIAPGNGEAEFPFTLVHSSEKLQYVLIYGGEGTLRVYNGQLVPEGRFYKDTAYISFVLILIAIVILFIPAKKAYITLVIAGIGLAASLPYLSGGLSWAIDLCYHLSRIEGLKDSIIAGRLHGAIYPEALFGNGYLGLMYPQLFMYPSAILRALGVSMADAYRTLAIGVNIATAAIMYYSVRLFKAKRGPAILAAALYTLSPYRITNIYARGAVGEYLAMAFFPLVVAGLWLILKDNEKKWPVLTIGMCGLLYTHLLSTLLGGILCAFATLVYIKSLIKNKNRLMALVKAAVLSVLLGLGFLVPFAYYMKNGNLWLSALDAGGNYRFTLTNISSFFAPNYAGDYHSLTLGIPLGILLFVSLLYLMEKAGLEPSMPESPTTGFDDRDRYILCLTVSAAVTFFMLSSFFPAGVLMDKYAIFEALFNKIQFAWRLVGPLGVFCAIAGALSLEGTKRLKPYVPALTVALIILALPTAMRFSDMDFSIREDTGYSHAHASKVLGIPSAKNTILYPYEWRPEGTADNGILTHPRVSDDTIALTMYIRGGTTTLLSYSDIEEPSFIDIPVIYYPGYRAADENGNAIPLGTGTNNMIRITTIPDGYEHHVELSYKLPTLLCVCMGISWIAAAASLVFCIKKKFFGTKVS